MAGNALVRSDKAAAPAAPAVAYSRKNETMIID